MRCRSIEFCRFLFLLLFFMGGFNARLALGQAASIRGEEPVLSINKSHFSIKAPRGWRVRSQAQGKSLIFEDPKVPKSRPGQVHYIPNLTVALMHEGRPVDELEADSLGRRIEKEFSAQAGVSAYRLLETRFIDYRQKADGILVYSAFDYHGIPMNQMHVFLSGSREAVLLTYTQLEASFADEKTMDEVWKSMMSAELDGEAPARHAGLVKLAAGFILFLGGLLTLGLWRLQQQRSLILRGERELFHDDEESREGLRQDASLSLPRTDLPTTIAHA